MLNWRSLFRWNRSAAERYFVTLLSFQTEPKSMRTSHTFATFSHLCRGTLTHRTISWLPVSRSIEPIRIWTEPGRNFTLQETIDFARQVEAAVHGWGPFECTREAHDLAMKKIERLESGEVTFVVVDQTIPHLAEASNCIHAVADLDPGEQALSTGVAHGDDATLMVLDHFRRWLIRPETTHRGVADSFGLPPGSIEWQETPVPVSK